MSKWYSPAKVYDNDNVLMGEIDFVFELKDRPQYKHRHMRELAKIVALDAEKDFNKENTFSKCSVDLRKVQLAADDVPLNYFPKSDYLEISIMTK